MTIVVWICCHLLGHHHLPVDQSTAQQNEEDNEQAREFAYTCSNGIHYLSIPRILRVCLLAIPSTGKRLWRSPNLFCGKRASHVFHKINCLRGQAARAPPARGRKDSENQSRSDRI